jgi:geranylgeranyl diphosphate synthase, type II
MTRLRRIETDLLAALGGGAKTRPPRLHAALHHAVFPGGQRLRPSLTWTVAQAGPAPRAPLASSAATAVELVHCASLVHDDLPCFDDAATRRGKPAVHRAFGEPLAVLVGDGLIVLAFEVLAGAAASDPEAASQMVGILARGTGAGSGIVAGQAWESERRIDLSTYHRQKTGGLFEAAFLLGAVAGGHDVQRWVGLGAKVGEAYQALDDLRDLVGDAAALGKPTGRDGANGRPNAARDMGIGEAVARMRDCIDAVVAGIPPCPRRASVRTFIRRRFSPEAAWPQPSGGPGVGKRGSPPSPAGGHDGARSEIP